MNRLKKILKKAGFINIDIEISPVSDEYASKWGLEIDLKRYIRKSVITAYK
ncbi:MAG: methyltransferase [Tissierellia bacterium]|nr:methyltransferase [Tissierellia bacterium]